MTSLRRISAARVFVLDASTARNHYELCHGLNQLPQGNGIVVRRFDADVAILMRISWALEHSHEAIVTLMADDDLVLDGWGRLVEVLSHDSSVCCAYGLTFRFRLTNGFLPYGELEEFQPQVPMPAASWQDARDSLSRLAEISIRPLTTMGWYAAHSRESLSVAVAAALHNKSDDAEFEYLLNLLQPILGRVHCVPVPALARQAAGQGRRNARLSRLAYARRHSASLDAAAHILATETHLSPSAARSVMRDVIREDMRFTTMFGWSDLPFARRLRSAANHSWFRHFTRNRRLSRPMPSQYVSDDARLPTPTSLQIDVARGQVIRLTSMDGHVVR